MSAGHVPDDPHGLLGVIRAAVRPHLANTPEYEHAELVSDAAYGVAQAYARWAEDGGSSLVGYCTTRARGAILDGRRDRSPMSRLEYDRKTTADADLAEHDRKPVVDELPAYRRTPLSVQMLATEARGEWTWEPPDPGAMAAFDTADARDAVKRLLNVLPDRERHVVVEVDLKDRTLASVGEDLAVTETRVCQIRKDAHRRMRRHVERAARRGVAA